MSSAPPTTRSPITANVRVLSIESPEDGGPMPHLKRMTRRRCALESSRVPLPAPQNSRSRELEVLRALIDRCAGSSPPSDADVQTGLESGLARLMLLEGRLRETATRADGRRLSTEPREDHDLIEEISALRHAVAELRGIRPAPQTLKPDRESLRPGAGHDPERVCARRIELLPSRR
jgi:hypothetical protein